MAGADKELDAASGLIVMWVTGSGVGTGTPRADDDESIEIVWLPIDGVPDRKLLTATRPGWPSFNRRLHALAAECKGR